MKNVGDSPALALLPSGNRGNKGLIHNLNEKQHIKQGCFHHWSLVCVCVSDETKILRNPDTHPCVFWYQSALMRLEVRMMTLKPSSYHSSIIFLQQRHKAGISLNTGCSRDCRNQTEKEMITCGGFQKQYQAWPGKKKRKLIKR